MRTIQPGAKYSSSRITDLVPNGVEEISVASRKVLADVLTQFATKSSIIRRRLISNGNPVS